MGLIANFVHRVLRLTPYELKRRDSASLPPPTFDAVKLALACYLRAKREPVIVQIGACDGVSGDPLHATLKSGGVRAVLVEPIPGSFSRLQQVYAGVPNVTLVNAAIAHTDGTMTLFKVKDGANSIAPFWGTQLASFDRNHILKHGVIASEIEAVRVASFSLASLVSRHGLGEIDLLQIDTEGFDSEIVKMALRLPAPPECINFENVNLTPAATHEVFDALRKNGYAWIHDEWNTLALHQRCLARWEEIAPALAAAG